VLVVEDERSIEVSVRDDGKGFDTDERHTGLGLVGMRERVELLDGTLGIESDAGTGTRIRAAIPVGVRMRSARQQAT